MPDDSATAVGDAGGTVPPASAFEPSSPSSSSSAPASSQSPNTAPPPSREPAPSGASSSASDAGAIEDGGAFDYGLFFGEAPQPATPAPEIPQVPLKPEVVAPEPPKPAAPQPPPPEAAKPADAPAAAPASAAQPAQGEPQPPALDTFDPGSLAQHLQQNEEAAIAFTAENMFKLTPEEVEALETNVVEAVPKLMAKAFVKSQLNVLSQLSRLIPTMVQRQTQAIKKDAENEGKFYDRWKDIKPDTHGALVRKYAAVYRQMHPNATLDQVIEDLGPMVMMAARIVPQASGAAPSPSATNPMASVGSANGRTPSPSPFVPAGAGATNASKVKELSPIEAMFQDQG